MGRYIVDIIEQTNRTILFDEINPEKMDLLTLVSDVKGLESLDDDKIKEINGHLLVKSFDEFLDKFEPTIYSFFNASNQRVIYSLTKPTAIPEDSIQTIPLDHNNDFLKMLLTMIQTRRAQGVENVDFRFDKILDMISPKRVMDDIKALRKEIHYLHGEYEKLEEGDPLKLEIADKLNIKFEEASKNYNNIMAMLPLAIDDAKQRLLIGQNNQDGANDNFIAGQLTMGDGGELKIIEIPKTEGTELMLLEEATNNALVEVFKEDYENVNDNPTDYVANLVIRTFCPLPVTDIKTLDLPKEVENYNHYLSFYQETKNDFIKVAKPLIEKILGVHVFFEQYRSKKKAMPPSLIVCNNKLDMLTKSSFMPRLQVYLNTVNNKNDFRNTIWFGIVGDIEFNLESNVKLARERFKGSKKVVKSDVNLIENLAALLEGISDYKIHTFFSFETCEETSFSSVATRGVDEYTERTQSLSRREFSEYAIPCLPNISVVPKNKSGVILDTFLKLTGEGVKISDDKKDLLRLWIEGVYIHGGYVAAGLVAACQCPEFLRNNNFKNVSKEFPGVRFDLEASDYALKVPTSLAKEISGYTNNIKDSINMRNFGFVFSSDNNRVDGKDLKQVTVYKARTLKIDDNNEYESLYKSITATYISRMMRALTSDYKHDNVVFFFSTNPQSQTSKWRNKTGFVNSILLPHDAISFQIEPENDLCNIDINFGGKTKNLAVLMNRSNAAAASAV